MKSHNRLFTATLILFLLLAQTVWAQSNWTIEQLTNTDETERNVDIEVEPDGDVHIVYEKRTYSGKGKNRVWEDHVYYAAQTGGIWGNPVPLGLPDLDERRPFIDIDANGVAHVVFDMGGLHYWNSEAEVLVAINNFSDSFDMLYSSPSDIAVKSNVDGTVEVHIVLTATNNSCDGNLFYTSGIYTSENGATFNSPIINIGTETGEFDIKRSDQNACIDIDEQGNIGVFYRTVTFPSRENPCEIGDDASDHISYVSKSNSESDFTDPQYVATNEEGVFSLYNSRPVILREPDETYPKGLAYILYSRNSNLLFDKWNPATSKSLIGYPILVAAGIIGWSEPSFDYQAIEEVWEPDILHVAYVRQQEIRYLKLNAENGEQFLSEGIHDGTYPNILVNADGTANISFTNSSDIFYATNTGTQPTPSGEMYASLNVYPERKGARWNAVAEVIVVDANSNPVSGALVTGHWTGCGCINSTNSAITNSVGLATLKSEMTKEHGTITFTLNDVVKDGWTYNIPDTPPSGFALGKQIAINDESAIPDNYALFNNYPNPFNPSTKIKYAIPEETYVMLKVYDVLGKEIASLVNQYQQPGNYEIEFDASNLANDVYFYILKAGDFVETKKMVLMK